MENELIRVHLFVTGRVQGVGFRAFVAQSAVFIGVTGWVRNVGLDSVEVMAEGSRHQVDTLVNAVKTGPRASRVDDTWLEEDPSTGEFPDFEIRSSR